MKNYLFLSLFFLSSSVISFSQTTRTENIVLVTLDGFRWQEVFKGADSLLLSDKKFTRDTSMHSLKWSQREKLMPFIWNVIGSQGQIYGNRQYGNKVNCANPYAFSYPGYSELLVGFVDHRVHSNGKKENPNSTVLEFIHAQGGFDGRVAAFSTWDVIPYIIRESKSGIFANDGHDEVFVDSAENNHHILNTLQSLIKNPHGARYDAFTFHQAFEYLKQQSPKALFISLDETDEHGHGGRYDEYLKSAHRSDAMIGMLWEWIQSHEPYKDKTTLIITTDHGRGSKNWRNHGEIFSGSAQIWFAVIGPDTPALGEMKTREQLYQKQLARTMAAFLGFNYENVKHVAPVVSTAFYKHIIVADK